MTPIIRLPHVPGHELAGEIVAVGSEVHGFELGARITVPFVSGCGACPPCGRGDPQVCDVQFQPGFTHWGSFAEYVGLRYAERNVVRLPDGLSYEQAASLGCRFTTAYRALVQLAPAESGRDARRLWLRWGWLERHPDRAGAGGALGGRGH